MKFIDTLKILNERKRGDKVYTSGEGATRKTQLPQKGRVKNYNTIGDALTKGHYGQIFTTPAANRLYTISKGKWGSKSGRGKIAKGFTPGSSTPNASFDSIKKHAARTMLRYGNASDKLAQKYGSRSIKKSRGLKYE
jgi:hypothetical protein